MREGKENWLTKARWHQIRCEKCYAKLIRGKQNVDIGEYVRVAQALKGLVKKKAYGEIMNLLNKTSLPATARLDVEECQRQGSGAVSRLFVSTPSNDCDYEVFKHLRFEDSPMGAWQAYLLSQLWHYLPLWWHANYSKRRYVYSKEDLADITPYRKGEFDVEAISGIDVTPEIYEKGRRYYVTCCFWTEFGGLVREYVEMKFKDNLLEELFEFKRKTIYEYECGLLF